jgi:hypothetical protein
VKPLEPKGFQQTEGLEMPKAFSVEQAKARALEVRQMYPTLTTVEDIIDSARRDNVITEDYEAYIVWGRLNRIIRAEQGIA